MKLYRLSILLAVICILIALQKNYDMALEYANVSGKTQALYGINHLGRFYYSFIGLGGLIFGLISLIRREKRQLSILAIFLSVGSIILTFVDIWKIFI